MTIGSTDIKFSDLQTEFGGTNPISLSEYYRDPTRTTAYLQDNGLNQSATSRPHNSSSNSSVPTTGEIKLSNFNGSREYAVTSYSYAGTGGLINFVNSNGFTAVTGGLWDTRYRLDNVFNFTVPYKGRIKISPVTFGVQGYYDSGGQYDDTDYSEVAYPGFRMRDSNGVEYFNVVGGVGPTYSNSEETATYNGGASLIAQSLVGVTLYIDIFCEGYIGESANPPLVNIGAINFSIAID